MTPLAQEVRSIFLAAVEGVDPDQWPTYLDERCAGDAALRRQVEILLQAHRQADSLLDAASPATIEESSLCEHPGTVIGPYKLLQQIGEGGMGIVWMAEQTDPIQRKVALKVIKPGMDSRQVVARFEAERQALALMDHVNIARVLDGGSTESGRPYFVMELVHGVPITRYCDDNHLTPRERLELFVPVCQAIQHAHQKGIIHRDIKPSNVMVTLYDGKPVPKVIDFGVAKATEQKLTERTLFTQYGTMVGTLEYMSPEQAETSALGVDTRSDIYSLGVLLYELLTGTTPLDRQRMKEAAFGEILRMIKEDEPPRPSTRLSDSGEALASISANRHTEPAKLTKLVRGELDWIVMKCLEKDRNRRYETANAFAADVQRYLADEAVQACPPSVGYRFRKFARRHKGALASGVVLALAVFAVAGTIGWAVRDREAQAEEVAHERAVRAALIEAEVNPALKEAEQLRDQGKWPEALSAAKRAQGLLVNEGSDELRDRARQLRKDVEMILRLDEIALLRSDVKDNNFDWAAADRAYAQAFAGYGIDVERLPADEAAARIRARPNAAEALAAALDDWALARRQNDAAGALALTALAQAADPDPWRHAVRQAVRRNDSKALAALAAGPEFLRQSAGSVLVLARASWPPGESEAHVKVLRQAQRQHPGDFWINYYLAVTLRDLSFARAALAVRPLSVVAHNALGVIHSDQKSLDEANASFRKAIELHPRYARAHLNLGLSLITQGKRADAITAFRDAIEIDPEYASAHTALAGALDRQGKTAGALAAYRRAIELDPKSTLAHYNFATMLMVEETTRDQAIAHFRKAIELDPKHANAHGNLALALQRQGKWDEALALHRKVIDLDPTNAKAHCNIGKILMDQGKAGEAIVFCRTAVDLGPNKASYRYDLGVALFALGKLDEAIICYRKAIELDPKHAKAHTNLGAVLYHQNRLSDAIACYRKALELDSRSTQARTGLAYTLGRHGWDLVVSPHAKLREPERAVASAKEAVSVAPQDDFAWQCLGWIEYRAGNWKASVEALDRSCKLQEGGMGDSFQWIVLALAHARIAATDGLPRKDQVRHWAEARRRYEQADQAITTRWRARPPDVLGQAVWDFHAEATKLMAEKDKRE